MSRVYTTLTRLGGDAASDALLTKADGDLLYQPLSGGGGTWGSITGTLSAQTDLATALNAKVALTLVGVANGVAGLDSGGLVPLSQLPPLGLTLTGDVTGSGTGTFATAIGANKVTRGMLAATAAAAFLGATAAGNVADLTPTQATSLLDTFTSGLKGLVPASGGGTVNYLRADGTWASLANPGFSPITATGTGASQNITLPGTYLASQVYVFVNGVFQTPTTHYTVSGTTLNLTTPSSGDAITIVCPGVGLTGATGPTGGGVTTVSVTTANGVSGSVANPTTTPAITLTLGAITPTSVAATGTVTGSNLSGTNTGDQTTISGQAGSVANSITFNTSGGAAAGTTFNGSAAKTIDYSTVGALALAGGTMTGKLNALASATGGAGFNIGFGATPSAPVAGDLWMNASEQFQLRGASTSYVFATLSSGQTFSGVNSFSNQNAFTRTSATTLASYGAVMTGISASTNLALDTTNVQARNNGAASTLNLNALGGAVVAGGALSATNLSGTNTGDQTTVSGQAGFVANSVTWNTSGTGAASGVTFNGSAAVTISTNTIGALALAGGTLTGKLITVASATGGAGFNLPAGTAPTTPADGDIWIVAAGTGLNWRSSGASYSAASLNQAQIFTNTNTFSGLLNLSKTTATTLGAYGAGMVGTAASTNIALDTTNIQARNNGAAATLNLNSLGGAVVVGGALSATNLSGTNTGDQTITLSGDATGSGTTGITVTVTARSKRTVFAASGTWTKDTRAQTVRVFVYGGGGSGGSGGAIISGTASSGGAGGGGGSMVVADFAASLLGATETVTIGAGGVSRAGVTGNVGGTAGAAGGNSTFGAWLTGYGGGGGGAGLSATGSGGGGGAGAGGAGGNGSGGTGGTAGTGGGIVGQTAGGQSANTVYGGGSGGSGCSSGVAGTNANGAAALYGGASGGAGGGLATTPANTTGGTGGKSLPNNTAGAAASAAGGAGNTPATASIDYAAGHGGGGGGASAAGTGGAGGAGQNPAGGGGGGGSAISTQTSGASGKGGDGLIVVEEFF